MEIIKYVKDVVITDKRFFPNVGEEYGVIKERNGRPFITNGKEIVWLHDGEFEVVK